MGYLRTPGFGPYTFGIAVPDQYSGPVAGQTGIWDLYKTGNTVVARFGGISLSGEIVSSNACHSIVISGVFDRRVAYRPAPDTMTLAMYIDGVATSGETRDEILQLDDPMVETVIGNPTATANIVALPAPVILNTTLSESTPWTLEAFSEELCRSL